MKTKDENEINPKDKLFAVEYAGFWNIQDVDGYIEGHNVLDAEDVGNKKSAEYAELFALSPQLLQALKKLSFEAQISGGTAGKNSSLMEAIEGATKILMKFKT